MKATLQGPDEVDVLDVPAPVVAASSCSTLWTRFGNRCVRLPLLEELGMFLAFV
jgi:hypothetical protein